MQKGAVFLAVVVGLVVAGLALSFYGSQIITEGLTTSTGQIERGETLEVVAELDPEIGETGVYVVQNMNFQEDTVTAKIFDEFDSQIVSEDIQKESFEGRFDISSSGKYKLVVENSGESSEIIAVIGHLPDTGKFSVGITGFYILIVGLIGMGGLGIYVVKNRKKR